MKTSTAVGSLRDAEAELLRARIAVLEGQSLLILERLRAATVLSVAPSVAQLGETSLGAAYVVRVMADPGTFGGARENLAIGPSNGREPADPAERAVLNALSASLGHRVLILRIALSDGQAQLDWAMPTADGRRPEVGWLSPMPLGLPDSVDFFDRLGLGVLFIAAARKSAQERFALADGKLREEIAVRARQRAEIARGRALVEAFADAIEAAVPGEVG